MDVAYLVSDIFSLTAWGCDCLIKPDIAVVRGGLHWSIRRRNLPCNDEDNLRVEYIIIEARFRVY